MLDLNYRAKIVERRIFDKSGNEYQASFLVVFKGGKFFWKVVSLVPVDSNFDSNDSRLCLLCGSKKYIENRNIFRKFSERVSPYLQNQFFVSQMTRAPSF